MMGEIVVTSFIKRTFDYKFQYFFELFKIISQF